MEVSTLQRESRESKGRRVKVITSSIKKRGRGNSHISWFQHPPYNVVRPIPPPPTFTLSLLQALHPFLPFRPFHPFRPFRRAPLLDRRNHEDEVLPARMWRVNYRSSRCTRWTPRYLSRRIYLTEYLSRGGGEGDIVGTFEGNLYTWILLLLWNVLHALEHVCYFLLLVCPLRTEGAPVCIELRMCFKT